MPLPGGASDKAGLRYELRWTVACMVDVMEGKALSIRLEPPGSAGEGVEFWTRTSSGTGYHQVKRQRTGLGRWSLSELASEAVLPNFYDKLHDPSATCTFVSTHAAHTLDELSDRARRAESWEEFQGSFLSSQAQSANFDQLHTKWGSSSKEDSFRRIQRVHVRTVDEAYLRITVQNRLETLVDGDAATVLDVLSELALEKVHHALTATDIWGHLSSRGFSRRRWAEDKSVIGAVNEQNRGYLAPLRQANIAGKVVIRSEVDRVLEKFDAEDGKNSVLITGEAGTGKSLLIPQVIEKVEDRGWPLLAFRVDHLNPTQLPRDLGRQLGLPGSPVNVLASISKDQECLLVIDQLDAVSLASARNPEFFDCIGAILDQTQDYPNMRVLIACRRFDLDNDHRFRQLTGNRGMAVEVPIGRFDDETVRILVTDLGLDAGELSPKQMNLLSLPFHLSLLAEMTHDKSAASLGFQTPKGLYDRFWNYKQTTIRSRLSDPSHLLRVVDLLADHMSRHQVLYAPQSLLDEFREAASVMASENILVSDDSKYSFFHESFFDYVFARRLETSETDILSFVLDGEQALFRRAQIRQVLVHQRDADREAYLRIVNSILTREDIRFHMKETVFALLGSLDDPTQEEWEIIEPLISSKTGFARGLSSVRQAIYRAGANLLPGEISRLWRLQIRRLNASLESRLSAQVWGILYRSASWFDLLDSMGSIQWWLSNGDEQRIDQTVSYLRSIQEYRDDRVAELLEPFVGASELWDKRLLVLVSWSRLGAGRRMFDLVLKMIDEGVLDELRGPVAANSDFWSVVSPLANGRPDWACEMIAHYCDRRLNLSLESGSTNPFNSEVGIGRHSQSAERVILDSAKGAPKRFVNELLPFVLKVIEVNADKNGNPPWRDPIWGYRFYGARYGLDHNFLTATEIAMRQLAENEPDEFRTIAEGLRSSEYETVQYLLIRSYAANGERFADDAVEYLLKDTVRLATGYSSDSHWATRQLLERVTPYCSDENFSKLEQMILKYYTPHERAADGRKTRGYTQLKLLEGLELSRLTVEARRRLQELGRKFERRLPTEPVGIVGGFVGSPIPDASASKMNNDQWLKAITRYSSESPSDSFDDVLKGGANELARVLEEQTKQNPVRFADLVHLFHDDANPAYFEAILRGITGTTLDAGAVVQVCLRCHRLPNRPCGHWITRPLAYLAESSLSDDALEMVAWYATEDPDPAEESWRDEKGEDGARRSTDPLGAGLNSVRGSAAESMARLIYADSARVLFYEPHLRTMVRDPSIVVRAWVALTLQGLLRHDRDLAVELFLELCNADDILLSTNYVETFLKFALPTHFQELVPILVRMIDSGSQGAAIIGARQACLASLTMREALPLARRCISGSNALRQGAAEVYARNLRNSTYRSTCEDMLTTLFSDKDEQIRDAAAMCFNGFEGPDLREYSELIRSYVNSRAFDSEKDFLIHALDETTAYMPEAVLMTSERFLDVAGQDAADIRTGSASYSNVVSRLVIRVYGRSTDARIRHRCLDLIDRMTAVGVYGLDRAIVQIER